MNLVSKTAVAMAVVAMMATPALAGGDPWGANPAGSEYGAGGAPDRHNNNINISAKSRRLAARNNGETTWGDNDTQQQAIFGRGRAEDDKGGLDARQ